MMAAGGVHHAVMLREAVEGLKVRADGVYVDGTFGAGGYSTAILDANRHVRVLALDRDPTAIAAAAPRVARFAGRLTLVEAPFSRMAEVVAGSSLTPVSGVVLDIGVSSMQIDTAARGFSFMADGPLDMRMGTDGPTVAELIASAGEELIADVIFHLGEERQARRIARTIVRARDETPITTTRRLAAIVEQIGRAHV